MKDRELGFQILIPVVNMNVDISETIKRWIIGISDFDFQTAQACGAKNFHAKKTVLTEMY